MPEWLLQLCGWIPGIVFPVASVVQLVDVFRAERPTGVSPTTWGLFALANVATYIYIQKYSDLQTVGFLLTGVVQVLIALVVIRKQHRVTGS